MEQKKDPQAYKDNIYRVQAQLDEICQKLEEQKEKFVTASAKSMETWYWEQTEYLALKKAETTKSLSRERIVQMKQSVRELQAKSVDIAKGIFGKHKWWHLNPQPDSPYDRSVDAFEYVVHDPRNPPKALDLQFRFMAGQLAPILEEYGYAPKSKRSPSESLWREWDKSGNYQDPNGRFCYPHRIEWSQDMLTSIKDYSELQKQGLKLVQQRETEKANLDRREAEIAWQAD